MSETTYSAEQLGTTLYVACVPDGSKEPLTQTGKYRSSEEIREINQQIDYVYWDVWNRKNKYDDSLAFLFSDIPT